MESSVQFTYLVADSTSFVAALCLTNRCVLHASITANIFLSILVCRQCFSLADLLEASPLEIEQ